MTNERRKFREAGRGPLAIHPKALDREFEASGDLENEDAGAGIAIIPIHGPIEHRASWFWCSYEEIIACAVDAFGDPSVRAVVLSIDSPGGMANGMIEASKKLSALSASSGKPLYAFVDEDACSAAYGLACAAESIILPPSGRVGSIGVIAEVLDATKMLDDEGLRIELLTTGARKGDGHPAKPFDDDVRAALQAQVDDLGDLFFELVAQSRGATPGAVAGLEAAVFMGKDAVSAGLADGVASWDSFLAAVVSGLDLARVTQIGSTLPSKAKATHRRHNMARGKSDDSARRARSSRRRKEENSFGQERERARAGDR